MPGWEIVNNKEKKALSNLISDNKGALFAHGFEKIRKKFHVREFEKKISKKFNAKHSLAVSSGTAALKISLKALGIRQGDEVLTQGFNFIATIEAILDLGAKPIIMNVDDTLNVSVEELKNRITKKTKAIILVHMLGVPADLNRLLPILRKKKINIISDNCESMCSKFKGKFINEYVDIEIFSLDNGKTITTGEGGLILTDNYKLYKYCRAYHDHGHENKIFPRGKDTASFPGFNFRMTEMQAVIGKEQLKKLNFIIKESKKRYKILEKNLTNYVKIRKVPEYATPNYDTFIFEAEKKKIKEVIKILQKEGIGTKNLPDAIRWHCAYFWKHALNKKQINYSKKTLSILSRNISIPILIKIPIKTYLKLGNNLKKIFK